MLAIEPLPETPASRSLIQDFDHFRHVVVVSPVAAEFVLEKLDHWWPQRPAGQTWYAVGPGTARRLQETGIECLTADSGHDSESLLQRPELAQLEHQKVLICSGEGGRAVLVESLRKRGAQVEKLALYRRRKPNYPQSRLVKDLFQFNPQAVIALSGETLNNLISLGQPADPMLFQRLLLVPTDRVAAQARAAGFTRVLTAGALDPEGLAARLVDGLS